MVEGVAGEGQPIALDRIGEDHRRLAALLVGAVQDVDDLFHVVPAEIRQDTRQLVIRYSLNRSADLQAIGAVHPDQARP